MVDIKKAVIPVAGLGTRFLPVSKSVPKELVSIGTTPILQLVIEEAMNSGIEEVILITSPIKKAIEDYFSPDTKYCQELEKANKTKMLSGLNKIIKKVKITYIEQNEPKGLGDAILRAKDAIGNESFCVLLPDHIFTSETPCTKQLINAYNRVNACINAVERVPKSKIPDYGIYEVEDAHDTLMKAIRVVEKPKLKEAPSNIAVIGRYLFTPEVFDILENLEPGKNGEIQLADAQNVLASQGKMYACLFEGFQFDTGDEWGFLKANIYLAYRNYRKETDEFVIWTKGKINVS